MGIDSDLGVLRKTQMATRLLYQKVEMRLLALKIQIKNELSLLLKN